MELQDNNLSEGFNESLSSDELDTESITSETLNAACGSKTTGLSTKAKAFSIDAILSQKAAAASLSSDLTENQNEDIVVDADSEEFVLSPADDTPHTSTRDNTPEIEDAMSPQSEDRGIPEEVCTTSPSMEKTKCTLEMTDLWKKFHELGTEMIITKSGRRMFPSLRVSFSDLEPKAHYQVYFDIAPVDNKRYRYAYHRSSWLVAGRADPPIPRRVYTHPDGPFRGDSLQKQSLSFEKVKLTNNLHDKWGYLILNSMHKYQPRVHLVKYEDQVPDVTTVKDLESLDRKVFIFPETQFIGVTAYQNQLITKLKIDSNPFAKGFRDSARITQIDRESVDLLIKASRQGYTQPLAHSMMASPVNPAMLAGLAAGKFPSLFPYPNLTPGAPQLPKEFIQMYLDQLSLIHQHALQNKASAASTSRPGYTNIRFSPYNR